MNRYAVRNASGTVLKRGFENKAEAKAQREPTQFVTKDVDHADFGVKRASSVHPKRGRK